jgi:prepilin peptidase CpaA
MTAAEVIAHVADGVLLVVLGTAVYTDVRHGKIYDWLTLPAIAVGLLLNYVAGGLEPAEGPLLLRALGRPFLGSVSAAALAFAIFGLVYLWRMVGGGDVKLMVAVAAVQRLPFFIQATIYTACAGAVMAVAVLIWRGRLRQGLRSSVAALVSPGKFRRQQEEQSDEADEAVDAAELTTIPYAVAIAVGTVAAWLLSPA